MNSVNEKENLVPAVCVVTDVRTDTPDVPRGYAGGQKAVYS